MIAKNTLKRDKVKEELLLRIRSGELRAGDRLPSERSLANLLGFGRVTVKNAIMELVEEGVLVRDGRRGTKIIKEANLDALRADERQKHILIAFYPSVQTPKNEALSLSSRAFQGVINHADTHNDIVIIQVGENVDKFLNSSIQVDGIILTGGSLAERLPRLRKIGAPIVVQDYAPPGILIDAVCPDHYEAGVLSARNLLAKGRERILFVYPSFPKDETMQPGHGLRWNGFKDTIPEGVKIFSMSIDFESLITSNREKSDSVLSFINRRDVDGVVCAIPRIHSWLKPILSRRKKASPEIVIIDCESSGTTCPEEDTIVLDMDKLGEYSCRRLYELMDETRIGPLRYVIPAYEVKAER